MATPSDIQQQIFDLLSRSSNVSFVSADQEAGERSGLIPGQKVTAEVLSILPDNRAQVQIGPDRFNLNLPVTVRQGQNLDLTFVSNEPRTTFAIVRQGEATQPVSLSDASRLLGLLADSAQIADSQARSSLQSIALILRNSPGEPGVLANLMDEVLTYGGVYGESAAASSLPLQGEADIQIRDGQASLPQSALTSEQARLADFESNASQILLRIARNSRFNLVEAVNQPVVPLMLAPGQEVDAAVQGTLPGNRAFVNVAGTALELVLPRAVAKDEILRLTVIALQPKPVFALPRMVPEMAQGDLSGASRWLSVLEHSEGGVSDQQRYVLDRLNTVLKSLPPDSPAFTAILDEAITYQTIMEGGQRNTTRNAETGMSAISAQQGALQQGNGIVLSDDMAKLLQALFRGNRLALVESLGQEAQPAAFTAGQQIRGEVLAALGGGRFLMQVAGQMFEFSMPKGTRPGDRAMLFFIANDPKPTFLMTRFGLPGDSQVSETGRWLSGFLEATADKAPSGGILGILRTLLSGPPSDADQVGAALQEGLRKSGLFYESHLARWFGGEYSLEDLLQEPQGRLSAFRQSGGMPMPAGGQVEEHLLPDMKNTSLEAMEAAFRKAGYSRDYDETVDRRAMPVVREQLETLQSGQVIFRGDLFAGQPLEWSVKERESRRNSSGGQKRTWDTALKVDLPRLGSITARLALDGNRVLVDFRANDSASAEVLEARRPELVEQLQAAGLEPGEIGVRHDAS